MSLNHIKLKHPNGFTLVELMMALAIIGIISAFAAPAFTDMLRTYHVRAATNLVISSISQARIEAMRRSQPVAIVGIGTTSCPASGWDCGWTSFVDTTPNGTLDAGEAVLQTVNEPKGAKVDSTNPTLRFTRWGGGEATSTFTISPSDANTAHASTTTVCFSIVGRISKRAGVAIC